MKRRENCDPVVDAIVREVGHATWVRVDIIAERAKLTHEQVMAACRHLAQEYDAVDLRPARKRGTWSLPAMARVLTAGLRKYESYQRNYARGRLAFHERALARAGASLGPKFEQTYAKEAS